MKYRASFFASIKRHYMWVILLVVVAHHQGISCAMYSTTMLKPDEPTWTFTHLKAKDGQKARLKQFIEKNWFAMDSIAVSANLIKSYELMENSSSDNQSWDFIVAVEYFNSATYEGIATAFEAIRKRHTTILIDTYSFKDLGSVIRSETLTKKVYLKSTH